MVGHGGKSAGSYLADPTSPISSHCASIVATSTLRVISCSIRIAVPCGSVERKRILFQFPNAPAGIQTHNPEASKLSCHNTQQTLSESQQLLLVVNVAGIARIIDN